MGRLTIWTMAAALVLAAPAVPAFAKVSPAVGNALKEAQKMARSNPSGASAKIAAARAAASTPEERATVSRMAAYVYAQSGNYGALAQELQSSGAPAMQVARAYYTARNYGKAVEFASKAGGPDGLLIVAQSYFQMGNQQKALDAYLKLVAVAPKSEYFAQVASLQFKTGDKAGYRQTLEKMIRRDPSASNWQLLLNNLKGQPMADPAKLALFQLIQETGNLSQGADIQQMAKLAMVTGGPTLAKSILDQGIASGKLTNDAATQSLSRSAATRVAEANAALPKLSASLIGTDVARAGRTQYANGNYPAAVALLTKAAKLDQSSAEADLYLGLAHYRTGDKAAAQAAFKAIPPGSVYADIGALWSLYISIKG